MESVQRHLSGRFSDTAKREKEESVKEAREAKIAKKSIYP